MFPSLLLRRGITQWGAPALVAALALSATARLQAKDASGGASTTLPAALSSPATRRALREFDRFLDHHPTVEDGLRLEPRLATKFEYLVANPELREFLRANPDVVPAVKLRPRYYLYRALLRQTSAPLPYLELTQLNELFDQQPEIAQELTHMPSAIRDETYLKTHGLLCEFLLQRPALARVFLPPGVTRPAL